MSLLHITHAAQLKGYQGIERTNAESDWVSAPFYIVHSVINPSLPGAVSLFALATAAAAAVVVAAAAVYYCSSAAVSKGCTSFNVIILFVVRLHTL
jgi:hypothetical protein